MTLEPSFMQLSSIRRKVIEGLDFILSHFKDPIWPRAISTHTTEGRQVLVYSREEALARYEQANFVDCRISAYPDYTEWHGINRQAPNLVFIDLDLSRFKSIEALDRALKKTLKFTKENLKDAYPTVIWSGNGYHIYLPTEAFVFESEDVFNKFENPSMRFLRFAESYLSNDKADPFHSNSLSFKNCMLRIPSSSNSECVLRNNGIMDDSTEVKIIQRWDGKRPAINWLLRDFRRYLIQEKIDDTFKDINLKRKRCVYPPTNHDITNRITEWPWVQQLLNTPIGDYRKFAIWRILAPYLVNIKKLSYQEAFDAIKDWLNKCSKITPLSFNANQRIKGNLMAAISVGYLPISFSDLKTLNEELHELISNSQVKLYD